MNDQLWKLAQELYKAIPGTVRNHKCGRAMKEQEVTMALYNALEANEKIKNEQIQSAP